MVLQQMLPGLQLPQQTRPQDRGQDRERDRRPDRSRAAAMAGPADPTATADPAAGNDPADPHRGGDGGPADRYATLPSPLGPVFVAFTGERVGLLAPAEDAAAFEWRFHERTGRTLTPAPDAPAWLRAAVAAGAGGGLRYDLDRLSRFERAVLARTAEIPAGEVRPYAWIATGIGAPNTVRAVGGALRRNPVPLLIPCHRVVRSDGLIGEYAIGAARKRRLLATEGVNVEWLERLARGRVRYMGTPSGRWCYPTCATVRATPVEDQAPLQTASAAAAAGYQPCERCRPTPAQSVTRGDR